MDFITTLPRTTYEVDSIWVILVRLTKSTHFILIQESSSVHNLVELYIKEVVTRHGVTVLVISDCDVRFTFRFQGKFHMDLGTRFLFSTAYHPHTNDKNEQTIQTIEEMQCACVLDFGGSWDTYLLLANFPTTTVTTPTLVCLPLSYFLERDVRIQFARVRLVNE